MVTIEEDLDKIEILRNFKPLEARGNVSVELFNQSLDLLKEYPDYRRFQDSLDFELRSSKSFSYNEFIKIADELVNLVKEHQEKDPNIHRFGVSSINRYRETVHNPYIEISGSGENKDYFRLALEASNNKKSLKFHGQAMRPLLFIEIVKRHHRPGPTYSLKHSGTLSPIQSFWRFIDRIVEAR